MEKQNKPTSVGICESKNTQIVYTIFEQIKGKDKGDATLSGFEFSLALFF